MGLFHSSSPRADWPHYASTTGLDTGTARAGGSLPAWVSGWGQGLVGPGLPRQHTGSFTPLPIGTAPQSTLLLACLTKKIGSLKPLEAAPPMCSG